MPRLHRHAPLLLAGLLAVTMPARAFNHIGLWPENHLCGPAVRPSELTGRVTVVVDWSIEVPESLAWLKLFNSLARDYADDPRVLFLTSYVSGTPKETVLSLSQASDNRLPTYYDFSLVDVRKCSGAHYAYIGDQTGKIVWAQTPKTDLSDLKAVKKACAEQAKRRAQEEEKAREREREENFFRHAMKDLGVTPLEKTDANRVSHNIKKPVRIPMAKDVERAEVLRATMSDDADPLLFLESDDGRFFQCCGRCVEDEDVSLETGRRCTRCTGDSGRRDG